MDASPSVLPAVVFLMRLTGLLMAFYIPYGAVGTALFSLLTGCSLLRVVTPVCPLYLCCTYDAA